MSKCHKMFHMNGFDSGKSHIFIYFLGTKLKCEDREMKLLVVVTVMRAATMKSVNPSTILIFHLFFQIVINLLALTQ